MALFKLQALLFLTTDQRQHIFFYFDRVYINDKPISHNFNLILAVIKFLTVFIVFASKKSPDKIRIVW